MIKTVTVSAALLAIAIGIIYLQHNKINRLSEERRQAIAFAKRDSAKAETYRNRFGDQVRSTELVSLSLRNANELRNTERLKYLNSLEGVKKSLRNLEAAVAIDGKVEGSITIPWIIDEPDSSDSTLRSTGLSLPFAKIVTQPSARAFIYRDEYNSIEGLDHGDSVVFKGKVQVPLRGAILWKRKKFLGLRIGRKEYSTELTSPNPWVNITNVDVIKIQR